MLEILVPERLTLRRGRREIPNTEAGKAGFSLVRASHHRRSRTPSEVVTPHARGIQGGVGAVAGLPATGGERAKGSGFYVGLTDYVCSLPFDWGKIETELPMTKDTAFSLTIF